MDYTMRDEIKALAITIGLPIVALLMSKYLGDSAAGECCKNPFGVTDKAHEIAHSANRPGGWKSPTELQRRYNLPIEAAWRIYDKVPYAYGPNGKGEQWFANRVATILESREVA